MKLGSFCLRNSLHQAACILIQICVLIKTLDREWVAMLGTWNILKLLKRIIVQQIGHTVSLVALRAFIYIFVSVTPYICIDIPSNWKWTDIVREVSISSLYCGSRYNSLFAIIHTFHTLPYNWYGNSLSLELKIISSYSW